MMRRASRCSGQRLASGKAARDASSVPHSTPFIFCPSGPTSRSARYGNTLCVPDRRPSPRRRRFAVCCGTLGIEDLLARAGGLDVEKDWERRVFARRTATARRCPRAPGCSTVRLSGPHRHRSRCRASRAGAEGAHRKRDHVRRLRRRRRRMLATTMRFWISPAMGRGSGNGSGTRMPR